MHQNRRRFIVLAAASLAAGVASRVIAPGLPAYARQAGSAEPVTLPLFRGEIGDAANVTLGAWGSGNAESSKDSVIVGTNSIKVTTDGLYQGARINFSSPIDLTAAFGNTHTYLRLQTRFSGANSVGSTFDPSSLQAGKQVVSPFANMRFVLIMADGSQYELIRPIDLPASQDPDSYVPIAFPLAAISKELPAGKTFSGDGAKLKQLVVCGDRYAQFSIGEINVITDETEISVAPIDAPVAFANSDTSFSASAEGGASSLRYSWDFDADDGIQEDAVGRSVTHVFPSTGKGAKTYKVTLTVSDVDGLKKPAVETFNVDVSD